jgi:uncharacterized protein (TIGR02246 family)
LLALVPALVSEASTEESAPIAAVVDAFHAALQRGDGKAAMELLAPDAVVLDSCVSQTREGYQKHQLAEYNSFVSATKTERLPLMIRQEGDVAWTTATSKTTGTFKGRKIDSTGVELMVLTKDNSGWRIRAIHWSSHANKSEQIK